MYGMRNTYIGRISLLVSILCGLALAAPYPSEGSPEKLIVKITVNSADKGEYLVHLDTNEDFLVKPGDLTAIGINAPFGKTAVIDGEVYQSLRSISGITYSFDRKFLILNIISSPSLLPKSVIDLSPPSRLTVLYPREHSAFLNYGLSYHRNDITDSRSFTVANKLGMRSGDVLLLTDSLYTKTPEDSEFVRLMSNVTYEWRGDLQWLVAGDTFASSGDLGSTINIGGISFAKMYRIDPYFIRQPMLNVSGVAALPSEASVYLDGMLIRKETLSPGLFDLNNLNYYGGAHLVEIVVKDAFGNEQRVVHPFYFTDALLKKRLHEYNYNAGLLREQFGVESNDYGDAAFSGFHRYGVSNALTLGGRAEATQGLLNIGPQAAFRIMNAGVVLLSLAASRDENDETGHAGSFNHTYQYRSVATRLLYKKYSEKYSTIQTRLLTARPKFERGGGVSYSLSSGSGLSLDYLSARAYDGTGRDVISGTYSRTITKNLSGFATARRIEDVIAGRGSEFLAGINMTFGSNTYGSSLNRFSKGTRDNMVQVYKNTTGGEGLSYRASYQSQDSDTLRSDTVSPYAQYNGRYGIYSADYSYQRTNDHAYNNYTLSASGAVVYTGELLGFTRPVNDSFSVVKVDGLKGVKVKLADIDMGTTDSSGTLIIPEIRSYNYNQVSLDTSNIPMDYQLSNVTAYISPSQWSGSCIVVGAKKIQAYTGRLLLMTADGRTQPVEMRELTMIVKDRTARFPTGKGGEFYFENMIMNDGKEQKSAFRGCQALSGKDAESRTIITPGTYETSFDFEGKKCSVVLKIEKSDDVIVDTGDTIGRCGGARPAPVVESPARPAAPVVTTEKGAVPSDDEFMTVAVNLDAKGRPVTNSDRKTLAHVLSHLRRHPELSIEVAAGDPQGTDEAGRRIGFKKAEAAKRYLIASGLNADRIRKVERTEKKNVACADPMSACARIKRGAVITIVRGNQTKPGPENK